MSSNILEQIHAQAHVNFIERAVSTTQSSEPSVLLRNSILKPLAQCSSFDHFHVVYGLLRRPNSQEIINNNVESKYE